jgi:Fe-S oxidoreductase
MSQDKKQETEVKKPPYDYAAHFAHVRNVADLIRDPDTEAWVSNTPSQPEHHQYVIWLGCNVTRTAHIAESLNDILRHVGADFVALGGPTYCCGAVHQSRGAKPVGDNMLRQTMKKFDTYTPERMLNWCPSCDTQLRKTPSEQLTETAKNRETVTTFLAKILTKDWFKVAVPLKVAIHAHSGTPDEEADRLAAHEILSRIPSLEIVEIPPVTIVPRHCSEVSINRLGPAIYEEEMRDLFHRAKAAGADHIVSIYHSCHRQMVLIQPGAPEQGLEIVNYLSLIARSLGLAEREDKFAELARHSDVDAMMQSVSANIQTHGLEEDKARKALTRQFGKQ